MLHSYVDYFYIYFVFQQSICINFKIEALNLLNNSIFNLNGYLQKKKAVPFSVALCFLVH